MIRINLAKTNMNVTQVVDSGMSLNPSISLESNSPVVKGVILGIFVVFVMIYERYNLYQKNLVLIQYQGQLAGIQAEVDAFGPVTNVIEDLLKEKQKLGEQLKVIKQISQKRAYKLNTITKVQESLPEDLWLNQLSVDKDTIIFKGLSHTPTSVQKVVSVLNDSDFITSAVNKEMKLVKDGDEELQEFEIEAKVIQ